MSDITSLLSLQARARRNAREQLVLVRQIRRDRAAAALALAELAVSVPAQTPARLTSR